MKKQLFLSVIALLIPALMFAACSTGADEVTSPATASEVMPLPVSGEEPFYGVGPELETRLKQVAMADTGIQALLEGKDNTFIVNGHTIRDQDYNLAVGVRLKDDITTEEFQEWMKNGRQDSYIIDEYTGVLNIGYNETYYLTFDMDNETISELRRGEESMANIPEVTAEEKKRAVEIALADVNLKQILEGKEYQIAPEGRIGVWHTGSTKIGVSFEISFDRTYTIEAEFPAYQQEPRHFTGEVEGLIIGVALEENRVASILPMGPLEVN